MLALGAPLLLLGLLLEDDTNLLVAFALFAGVTVAIAAGRMLWRRPRTEPDSPWWGLLVLVILPIGFAAEMGTSAMVVTGGLLFAQGLDTLRPAPAARRV